MSWAKENNDKFTEPDWCYDDDDSQHVAYHGWFVIEYKLNTWEGWDDRVQDEPPSAGIEGTIGHAIITPYFKHEINCKEYTRKLCNANGVPYDCEKNIRAAYGKWTHANGDEIDESKVPLADRFEKR
mgnify:FL=1